jgi:hypothetical protein
MSHESDMMNDIRRAFKETAVAFHSQLSAMTPPETTYALLFEISDQAPGAWPIGATEQSLTRLADKYVSRGYVTRDGNHQEVLRSALRWKTPGDDMDGWYWAADGVDTKLNSLITTACQRSMIRDDKILRELCLEAFQEIRTTNSFSGSETEIDFIVGFSVPDTDFCNFADELESVNPPSLMDQLRNDFIAAAYALDQIASPRKKPSVDKPKQP